MQKLGRLLNMLVILALGFGTSLHAFAAPVPMDPAGMTAESHAAMVEGAGGSCSTCAGEPGMMLDCLPSCMSVPTLASQMAVRFPLRQARYDFPAEQSFTGAHSRPDPYPPRPIILS